MKRHLIWIIAGTAVLGLGIPAFAASRSDGTPDDNGVPGDVRGNCDEAEHANDPDCASAIAPGPVVVTVPSTSPVTTTPDNTIPDATVTSNTVPSNTVPSNTVPSNTVPSNTVTSNSAPGSSVPSTTAPDDTVLANTVLANTVAGGGVVDVSGPCDDLEHVNDPR